MKLYLVVICTVVLPEIVDCGFQFPWDKSKNDKDPGGEAATVESAGPKPRNLNFFESALRHIVSNNPLLKNMNKTLVNIREKFQAEVRASHEAGKELSNEEKTNLLYKTTFEEVNRQRTTMEAGFVAKGDRSDDSLNEAVKKWDPDAEKESAEELEMLAQLGELEQQVKLGDEMGFGLNEHQRKYCIDRTRELLLDLLENEVKSFVVTILSTGMNPKDVLIHSLAISFRNKVVEHFIRLFLELMAKHLGFDLKTKKQGENYSVKLRQSESEAFVSDDTSFDSESFGGDDHDHEDFRPKFEENKSIRSSRYGSGSWRDPDESWLSDNTHAS